MRRVKSGLLLLSCIALGEVHALDADRFDHLLSLSLEQLMEQQVSISTDTKHAIASAPSVVSVITAEDIKATGATNLSEALEGVPGVHVRASQFGNRPLVHFRGANATQTLLMVNGNPMRDLAWGFGMFWKGLPASIIDRVEIIRGPGSALFGADASAGVINVITKTAGKIQHNSAGPRLGDDGSAGLAMQYGGNWGGLDIGFTADLQGNDGYAPFIARDRLGNAGEAQYGWDGADLRFSVAQGNWRLLADYTRHDGLETGISGSGVLDPVTRAEDSRFNLDLLYNNARFAEHWALNAELRLQHLDYSSGDGFQEAPAGYVNATADGITDGLYPAGLINRMAAAERQLTAEVSALYSGFQGHALLLGLGHRWQELYQVEQQVNFGTGPDGNLLPAGGPLLDLSGSPFAFAPERGRELDYLYLQDDMHLTEDWELVLGARYDRYSDFGDALTPRLGLVWQATDRLTAKLMYGEAFRAPSFQELYAETSFTLPNADLQPERSATWDLAFSYAASQDLRLNLNLFHYDQHDLIRAIGMGLAKPQFQNSGDQEIDGIELEAWWQASDRLRLYGNYTWREQADSPYRAYGQPDREAYLRLDWAFQPQWNWNIQGNWIGERGRNTGASPPDLRVPVDDYLLTDTSLRYSGFKNLECAASIRNLFDVDAREYTSGAIAGDLPLAGRTLRAELLYRF